MEVKCVFDDGDQQRNEWLIRGLQNASKSANNRSQSKSGKRIALSKIRLATDRVRVRDGLGLELGLGGNQDVWRGDKLLYEPQKLDSELFCPESIFQMVQLDQLSTFGTKSVEHALLSWSKEWCVQWEAFFDRQGTPARLRTGMKMKTYMRRRLKKKKRRCSPTPTPHPPLQRKTPSKVWTTGYFDSPNHLNVHHKTSMIDGRHQTPTTVMFRCEWRGIFEVPIGWTPQGVGVCVCGCFKSIIWSE